ncbi:putative cyclin-D6-1 [Papaver somniferum]|uniref:putative cyclin-D6-1 n=1 Tax=Papaver somniferum TaxID=3469 RepID=UPI000E704036|nr:putative cyclin-D6-1 [Papaver somniferum]
MEYELENPLTGFEEHQSDTIPSLFSSESDHMTYISTSKSSDLDVSVRRQAIPMIFQFSCNSDPFVPYLAVNYLDRFISRQELPHGKPWMIKLLCISCLSLAAKMKQNDFSLTDDIQRKEGFIFDTETIQRMELLILGALKWRMRSITPFSFIYFFISLLKLKDPQLRQALKNRATQIIFTSQHEIKLLEFKPSIIAASALISASHELFPLQFPSFRTAISSCIYVNKEKLLDCWNVMNSTVMNSYESVFDMIISLSTNNTPVNVLDLHFSTTTSQSEKAATATVMITERDIKRRKISGNDIGYCGDKSSFQVTQIQQC